MERKKGVLLNQLPGQDSQRALDPHPGQASPHSSLRASKSEHQAGAQPCPKGPQRPLRQRPHCPGSPPSNRHRLESCQGGVYVL